jgi:hypothetical protein
VEKTHYRLINKDGDSVRLLVAKTVASRQQRHRIAFRFLAL